MSWELAGGFLVGWLLSDLIWPTDPGTRTLLSDLRKVLCATWQKVTKRGSRRQLRRETHGIQSDNQASNTGRASA